MEKQIGSGGSLINASIAKQLNEDFKSLMEAGQSKKHAVAFDLMEQLREEMGYPESELGYSVDESPLQPDMEKYYFMYINMGDINKDTIICDLGNTDCQSACKNIPIKTK